MVRIFKKGNKRYYVYKESCKNCGEPFLGDSNNIFCCCECQLNSGEYNPFFGKHHTKKQKEIWSKNRKGNPKYKKFGKDAPCWKGGYYSKGIPRYDTYAPQLEWCEEVRRNEEDPNVLEVRCIKCNKWYVPDRNSVRSRIQVLKGNYKGECEFYCSEECKHSCSIYGKQPKTLMKEDAIRAGRLQWLELDREVQPELRRMVLERDGYQCVKCGSTENLHCHHIYPEIIEPLESADMDNCIIYCIDCHKEAHKKDGCKYGQLKMDIC